VPKHFHITEVGVLTKHFIDCGGDIHEEKSANLQIWVADDFDHKLEPQSLLNILKLSEKVLQNQDLEIEVEYQTDTIGKYSLSIEGGTFSLVAKETDCLAKTKCNIPQSKSTIRLSELTLVNQNCCTPGGGCC
jgi:Family of unknown function (DUF6428)